MTLELVEAVTRLRATAKALGYSLDHLSDAEVLEAARRTAQEFSQAGVSMELMAAGLQKIGRAWPAVLAET